MKKIIIKYLMMYLPFVLGGVLFSNGVINLFSSLLLFVGGYIAIKNTLDYRLVKKRINRGKVLDNLCVDNINLNNEKESVMTKNTNIKPINYNVDKIVGVKRVRRYTKVRRRY